MPAPRELHIEDARGRPVAYPVAEIIVRFSSPAGASYEVRFEADGVGTCTCPSFVHRHAPAGTACKHIAALVALAGRALYPEPDTP